MTDQEYLGCTGSESCPCTLCEAQRSRIADRMKPPETGKERDLHAYCDYLKSKLAEERANHKAMLAAEQAHAAESANKLDASRLREADLQKRCEDFQAQLRLGRCWASEVEANVEGMRKEIVKERRNAEAFRLRWQKQKYRNGTVLVDSSRVRNRLYEAHKEIDRLKSDLAASMAERKLLVEESLAQKQEIEDLKGDLAASHKGRMLLIEESFGRDKEIERLRVPHSSWCMCDCGRASKEKY